MLFGQAIDDSIRYWKTMKLQHTCQVGAHLDAARSQIKQLPAHMPTPHKIIGLQAALVPPTLEPATLCPPAGDEAGHCATFPRLLFLHRGHEGAEEEAA